MENSAASSSNHRRHILIVEDNPGLGKTLLRILQKAAYEGEWVATGEDALDRLKRSDPRVDVILIDLQLPGIHGLDLLRAAKQIHPDVGAIMVTGHADTQTAISALNEGAFAYIEKPYFVEEVKANVTRLIEKQELVQENRELLKKMLELNAELENRVRQRTADLQLTNLKLADTVEQLRKADQIKSDFVTLVSHELRTPLTVIIGCTQTLAAHLDVLDKDTLRKYLTLIDGDAHRLARLAEEVLDLSRIEKKRLELRFDTFDLKEVVEGVAQHFQKLNGKKVIQMVIQDQGLEISSDADRVRQILTNLVENAVKYTPEGGTIQIEVRNDGPEFTLSVIDSGPGISASQGDHIFEPFFRTQDAINFKHPGTGLGLTITKALVEALGGRIWLEKHISLGCKFTLTLPKLRPEADDGIPSVSFGS